MNDRTLAFQQGDKATAYETHDETPTLTLVGTTDILTVPYIAFNTMRRDAKSGQLQLEIEGFRITLQGNHLRALWRDLQLYRVREIHEQGNREEPSTTSRTLIEKITIKSLGEV